MNKLQKLKWSKKKKEKKRKLKFPLTIKMIQKITSFHQFTAYKNALNHQPAFVISEGDIRAV